jgi:hypothetical protein
MRCVQWIAVSASFDSSAPSGVWPSSRGTWKAVGEVHGRHERAAAQRQVRAGERGVIRAHPAAERDLHRRHPERDRRRRAQRSRFSFDPEVQEPEPAKHAEEAPTTITTRARHAARRTSLRYRCRSWCLVAGSWPGTGGLGNLQRCLNGSTVGLTGFIVTTLIAGYWMIPSTIDRAVVMLGTDMAKIITLWLCGVALQHSMQRAPMLVEVFFLGYTLPTMVWLGLYYAATDLRLCNAYSLESQLAPGKGLVVLGSAAGAVWLASLCQRHKREAG